MVRIADLAAELLQIYELVEVQHVVRVFDVEWSGLYVRHVAPPE